MPSLKEVRNRIKSVQSTQQITKAMKMVAAAKLRKSQDAILQLRPYAGKLGGVIANLSASVGDDYQNDFAQVREPNKVLLILVSSDRGLCGAFNSNLFKLLRATLADKYAAQHAAGNVTILTLGRKGSEFSGRMGYKAERQFTSVFENFSFDKVRAAAEWAMEAFQAGEYDVVEILYNEFKNVATQVQRVEQVLPLQAHASGSSAKADYIFEPSAAELMEELIPKAIKVQIFRAVLESAASEQGARMTAMDKATDNAGELLKQLKLTYNQTRQAYITKEILEIVGGAEALSSN